MARGGGIKKVGNLFEVYRKRLRAPQKTIIDEYIEVAKDVAGIVLTREQVSYSPPSKTLSIRASGVIKTELQFKKEEMLNHLKGRLGEQNAPRDIL